MQKFLTDVHTHSAFSFDGKAPLVQMLQTAQEKGLVFYGVSEHFDYDVEEEERIRRKQFIDEDGYFHDARHLQEDYAGCLNVLIGAEFGFAKDEKLWGRYAATVKKHRPDFIVNSVHTRYGIDYHFNGAFRTADGGEDSSLGRKEILTGYLTDIRNSLDAPYPYDIVGHFGYVCRYLEKEKGKLRYEEFPDEIDDILQTIIQKDKILEVNSSVYWLGGVSVTDESVLRRYFELGGRKISFGSDAHAPERIADKREGVTELLRKIGFTYVTVPCRGEHIKVEI